MGCDQLFVLLKNIQLRRSLGTPSRSTAAGFCPFGAWQPFGSRKTCRRYRTIGDGTLRTSCPLADAGCLNLTAVSPRTQCRLSWMSDGRSRACRAQSIRPALSFIQQQSCRQGELRGHRRLPRVRRRLAEILLAVSQSDQVRFSGNQSSIDAIFFLRRKEKGI